MLKPPILLGDRIEYSSNNVFAHIQRILTQEHSVLRTINNTELNNDLYALSVLLSPLLYNLNSKQSISDINTPKDTFVKAVVHKAKKSITSDGSSDFSTPKVRINTLFSTSLCTLNLLKLYQDNLLDTIQELSLGLNFLYNDLSRTKSNITSYRADEVLAGYTLLQAALITKNNKYFDVATAFFNPITSTEKPIQLSKKSLLPNSIDEGLVTRILFELYEIYNEHSFLLQAQNLSQASITKQKKILDSFQSGGLGSFFGTSINLTVLSLACYNWLKLYSITNDNDLLDISGHIMRFISDVIDRSQNTLDGVYFPAWIKPKKHEISLENSPLGARFYLDAAIFGINYFPVSIRQSQEKNMPPHLRVRA